MLCRAERSHVLKFQPRRTTRVVDIGQEGAEIVVVQRADLELDALVFLEEVHRAQYGAVAAAFAQGGKGGIERLLVDVVEDLLAEERRKKEQAISNKVAGAFGIGSQEGNSQGDTGSGTGNQGSPFGNSDHGANEGVGGYGSFNLNGRSIGAGGLPRPAYTIQEEGRIVINITVDPKGNVIFAEIGKGTNIDNGSMRKSALDAAKRAKFNSISGANNQSGTITYLYKLK